MITYKNILKIKKILAHSMVNIYPFLKEIKKKRKKNKTGGVGGVSNE